MLTLWLRDLQLGQSDLSHLKTKLWSAFLFFVLIKIK